MLHFHDAMMGWQVELLRALEHFADGDLGKYQELVGFADADLFCCSLFFWPLHWHTLWLLAV